jgi:chromosome segregation ATPase
MKDLQDRDSKSVKDEEKRTADFDQKLKALQDREAALSRQENEAKSSGGETNKDDTSSESEKQSQREADIQRKLDDLKSAEQRLAADRAELQKAQNDLAKRENDVTQRQKDASEAANSSTNGHAASEKTAEQRLERTQKDNAGLEQRLAKLEDQLAKMARSPEKAPEGKAQANGKTDASKSRKTDASSPGCGYKHYKPPRKLNRKLIGMVYE